jgi:hypothetical protein
VWASQLGENRWIAEYQLPGAGAAVSPADATEMPVSFRTETEAKAAALWLTKAWIDG